MGPHDVPFFSRIVEITLRKVDRSKMGRPGGRRVDNGSRGQTQTVRPPKDAVHLAFCIAYVGTAFRGLQLQGHAPMHHTVEGAFVQALREAGVLLKLERGRIADPNHFIGRSCRTDRGVHAVRNMISLFIPASRFQSTFHSSTECIRSAVQRTLPPPIEVLNVTRVMPTFSTKNCCNRRVYNYYIPAYAIVNAKVDSWENLFSAYPEAQAFFNAQAPHSSMNLVPTSSLQGNSSNAADRASSVAFLDALADKVALLNAEVTSQFVGSHRFHNYTTDVEPGGKGQSKTMSSLSDECVRMIIRCQVAPRVYFMPTQPLGPSNRWLSKMLDDATAVGPSVPAEVQKEIEFVQARMGGRTDLPSTIPFVVFQVEGASFLLNMIRKMVGTLIAVARGTRASMVGDSLSPYQRVTNPMAPGPYLSLALSFYQGYDSVIRDINEKHSKATATNQSSVANGCGQPAVSYSPLEESWHDGGVDGMAAQFFREAVIPDFVDADLNRAVPLDTTLYLRDYLRSCNETLKVQDAQEDAHLPSMKEYVPSKPFRCPPVVSEMTVFLRMLRMHNWNIRPVEVPENCKTALEYANKLTRLAAEKDLANADMSTEAQASWNVHGKRQREEAPSLDCVAAVSVPERIDFLDDGWIYVGNSVSEEAAARSDELRARFLALKQTQRLLRSVNKEQEAGKELHDGPLEDVDDALLLAAITEGQQFCGDGD